MRADMELVVPEHCLSILRDYVNKEITLGLRPEHFNERNTETESEPDGYCRAIVRLVEPLGSEQLIHLEMKDQHFIARLDPRSDIRYGQTLDFQVDMESASFFDSETEERIC